MASKIDMSLDQIIKMGKRQGGANGGRNAGRGGRLNRRGGGRRDQNQQRGRGPQQRSRPQLDGRAAQATSQGGRRGFRRRGGRIAGPQNQHQHKPQPRQNIASVIQRPQGGVQAAGVRYNMKTGRVRGEQGRRRRGGLGNAGSPRREQLVSRQPRPDRGNVSPVGRRRDAARSRPARAGGRPLGAAESIQERAALVRRLIERARKRDSQTHARQDAIMQRRGLSNTAAKTSQQRTIRAARKRVAAATRRTQFSAALRRGTVAPKSNLKVSVALERASANAQPNRSQLVRKYRAEARKLIEAVKTTFGQPGRLTVSD